MCDGMRWPQQRDVPMEEAGEVAGAAEGLTLDV